MECAELEVESLEEEEDSDAELWQAPGGRVGLGGCSGAGSGGACAFATCCTRWAAADSPRYTWSNALGGGRYVPVGEDELAPCPWQVHKCVVGQSIGGSRKAEEQLGLLHRHWASLAGR